MRLAIVIPTLDEERSITDTLSRTLQVADEVCVSDGGSSDATVEIARSMGARVVIGGAGRGAQLNRGADAARADALLFLHADTRLPEGAAEQVRRALGNGAVGGGFRLRFEPARGALKSADRFTDLRTRITGWPLGDQAQFASREAFSALGGFRDWPILEDLDFIRRLKRFGRTVILADRVTTSSRRFLRHGATRTIATNYLIWLLYFAGVSPEKLARLYRHIR